jgi:hypothetical protein
VAERIHDYPIIGGATAADAAAKASREVGIAANAVGLLDTRLQVVGGWRDPQCEGVVSYLDEGRMRGALRWNSWDQVDAARSLIAEVGPLDAASLHGRLPVNS